MASTVGPGSRLIRIRTCTRRSTPQSATTPLPAGHPLLALNNVVLTPHIAAGTADALVIKMKACFANMLRVTRGEAPLDVVAPALPNGGY